MPQPTPLIEASPSDGSGTSAEAAKAARDALAQVLRDRVALARTLDAELADLIDQAIARITAQLADAPSDYQQWVLPRLMDNIARVLDELATSAGARTSDTIQQSWALGEKAVDAPIQAAAAVQAPAAPGLNVAVNLGAPQLSQLRAMQQFSTSMIKGATGDAVKTINRALGQVVLGASTPFDAIKVVSGLLPDRIRSEVRGIVNTNLATAFNSAAHAQLLAQAQRDPGLRKQWRRSGKVHSRANHDAADGQVQEVDKPFVLQPGKGRGAPVEIMFPADPKAPIGETINCGCVMLAWKAGWKMRNPAAMPSAPARPAGAAAKKAAAPAAKKGASTQSRILAAAAAAGGVVRDPMGQRLVVNATLAPEGIGDARLTKAGQDLYSYWAVQALRRPTEVWQGEHIDSSAGEVVRTRIYLKRFTANGNTWLGRADFRFDGRAWVPTKAYKAELVGQKIDQALQVARAGVRVWPIRK